MLRLLLLAAAVAGLAGCAAAPAPVADATAADRWLAAIEDAAVPTEAERAFDLVALTPETPDLVWRDGAVKMVAWMSQASYDRLYAGRTETTLPTTKPILWVTAAPQVQAFCRGLAAADPAPRLKQYLGLAADWSYDVFVEFWVPPAGLLRPCPDQEVTDATCEVAAGPTAAEEPWYADLYRTSYLPTGAPWTRLGYTYDWAPDSPDDKGASEFMVRPGTTVAIADAVPTAAYCR